MFKIFRTRKVTPQHTYRVTITPCELRSDVTAYTEYGTREAVTSKALYGAAFLSRDADVRVVQEA